MRPLALSATLALLAGPALAQPTHGARPPQPSQASLPPAAPAPQPTPAPGTRAELTLYELPSFQGRQYTWYGPAADVYKQGFPARSARGSGGTWVVCDSGLRNCIQVSGQMATLPLDVAVIRTSRNELTLYEGQNFQGRQSTWYGASNDVYRQGFQARSARATGGPWAVCEERGRCVTVDGSSADLGVQAASVRPGPATAVQGGRGQGGAGARDTRWGPQQGGRDDIRYTRWICQGGVTLFANFDDNRGAVKVRAGGEDPDVLDQVRSGYGRSFRYENGVRAFYGQDGAATYVVGRRAPLQCSLR